MDTDDRGRVRVGSKGPVCVTGATGFIGSWLIKSLLQTGYLVHATARDPGKASCLLSPLDGNGRLKIFKADLNEEGSFDEALKGCVGMFHVAAQMVFMPLVQENVGDPLFYPVLVSVHSRLGSFPYVHIEDICNAHIFLMEQSSAEGRYICAAGSCLMPQLIDLLSLEYPSPNSERFTEDLQDFIPPVISSNRLMEMGFKFKFDLQDIIKQSVSWCTECGFLKSPDSNSI